MRAEREKASKPAMFIFRPLPSLIHAPGANQRHHVCCKRILVSGNRAHEHSLAVMRSHRISTTEQANAPKTRIFNQV